MVEMRQQTPPPAFTDHQAPTPLPHSPASIQAHIPHSQSPSPSPSPSPQYYDPTQNDETAYPQHDRSIQEKPIPTRTRSAHAPERVPTQGHVRRHSHGSSQYLTATPLFALTSHAAPVDCPSCGRRAMTKTTTKSGNFTHLWGALTCAIFCLGCIPYLISSLKDVKHSCSNCGTLLAIWHRSGGRVDVLAHPLK